MGDISPVVQTFFFCYSLFRLFCFSCLWNSPNLWWIVSKHGGTWLGHCVLCVSGRSHAQVGCVCVLALLKQLPMNHCECANFAHHGRTQRQWKLRFWRIVGWLQRRRAKPSRWIQPAGSLEHRRPNSTLLQFPRARIWVTYQGWLLENLHHQRSQPPTMVRSHSKQHPTPIQHKTYRPCNCEH